MTDANGTSDLTLWVSNQSYTDKNVDVTVALDGVVIIDRSFHVGDQHNYIEHRIQLGEGTHILDASTVIDGQNIELSEEFSIEPGQQRYAGLNYWHYVPTGPTTRRRIHPGSALTFRTNESDSRELRTEVAPARRTGWLCGDAVAVAVEHSFELDG